MPTPAESHRDHLAQLTLALAKSMEGSEAEVALAHRALSDAVAAAPLGSLPWIHGEVVLAALGCATRARYREVGSLYVACQEVRDMLTVRIIDAL